MSNPLEPIAIVGLACRFPGDATTPEKLWDIVHSGQQCWSEVPESRYNWRAFHHPSPDAQGTHNARGGFFLNQDLARFDANFFNIPAAEAAAVDPQQRLLLEVSYEALENAGHTLTSIRGSNTGVYVALVSRDYDRMGYRDSSELAKHHLTGCGDATACGRISYVFDLRGPSVSLDTGCSGGMVALHLAVQALRAGETEQAIVGGTNLLLAPDMSIAMSALHMMNDNGRCYPFDARGDGYGRAEGVAALVLKRLSDAVRDGNSIRAVIRNTGVNQDGKTNGILLPSSEAQQELARGLYVQAGIDPLEVGYVEAHGTGTQAGDAAEVTSIQQVFTGAGKCGSKERQCPLYMSSVKANIGHSESTSGLAGVIKTVLALEKGVIPPQAGLKTLKPTLGRLLRDGNIIIPQKPCPWPSEGPRLASINSFGFGGTNAHAILESYPRRESTEPSRGLDQGYLSSDVSSNSTNGSSTPSTDSEDETLEEETPQLFNISARSRSSLEKAIDNVQRWVSSHGKTRAKRQQLAQTLILRRSLFTWRSTFIASSYHGLLESLGNKNLRLTKSPANAHVVFLFTGQGAQYAGMGRGLLHLQNSSFASSLYRSRKILIELGASWDLIEQLLKDDASSKINSSELAQPATTAIQIALVDMLADVKVKPTAVLGHSSGEVAAAYAAGILGHREALTIAYYKGFVAGWCKEVVPSKGAMLAVGLSETEATQYQQRLREPGDCVIACVNSPSSVTLSGDENAVAEMEVLLNKDSVFNRRLKVDVAYHSHHMKAVSQRFHRCIQDIKTGPAKARVCFFSSVTGLEERSPLDATYWIDNLVSQVRFSPALEQVTKSFTISSSENLALVEVGPHSALQGPIRQIMSSVDAATTGNWSYIPTLVRSKHSHFAILEAIGGLFEQGVQVDFTSNIISSEQQQMSPVTDLTPYPWDHSSPHWHESRLSKDYRFRKHPPHDLLGLRVVGTSPIEPVFRHILSVQELPWLQEHIIDGFALYPGSAFLCMAIEALKQISTDQGEQREITRYVFRGVTFTKALVVPDAPGSVEVLISLKPGKRETRLDLTWNEFRITSVSHDGTWNEHCRGSVRADFQPREDGTESAIERFQEMRAQCHENISTEEIYAAMRRNGIDYGDSFTIIRDLQVGDHQAIGKVRVPDIRALMPAQHMSPHVIHPAVFDAFMHIALPLYHRHCSPGPVMLVSAGEVSISSDILKNPGDELLVACRLAKTGRRAGSVEVNILQQNSQGDLIQVGSLSQQDFRAIGEGTGSKEASGPSLPCYSLEWTSVPWFPSHDRYDSGSLKFHVHCISEDLGAGSLGSDLASSLRVAGYSVEYSASPPVAETADPATIHVMLIDKSCTPGNLMSAVHNLRLVLMVNVTDENTFGSASTIDLMQMVQQEVGGQTVVTLTYEQSSDSMALEEIVTDIAHHSFSMSAHTEDRDLEFMYRQGALLVPRLGHHHPASEWLSAANGNDSESIEEAASFHGGANTLELNFKTPGLLASAIFVPVEQRDELEPDEILVKVYAHGINTTDVAIALDRADPTERMIGEFAGVVVAVGEACADVYKPRDRVCGWGSLAYTNMAKVKRHLVHLLNDSISFAEGASIPVAFQSAYHSLFTIAGLGKDHSILIHGAAGAVGQAAIAIAQHIGAEIYATVGCSEKERLLIAQKDISKERIFSSRRTAFKEGILKQTKGKGVDIVLNCSSEELLDESSAIVAEFGYLIDITKSKRPVQGSLGRNITFASIDMQLLAERRPKQVEAMFARVMTLYNEGKLKPVTLTRMSIADISSAFRLVQSQRHSGKIVLDADEQASVRQVIPKSKPMPLELDEGGVYAVVGGHAAMNYALCTFLGRRGAKKILSIRQKLHDEEEMDFSSFDTIGLDTLEALPTLSSNLRGILHVESAPKARPSLESKETGLETRLEQREQTRTVVGRLTDNCSVDFCITIASLDGLAGRDCYAPKRPGIRYTALRLGAIEGLGTNQSTQLKVTDLYSLLDFSITTAREDHGNCREIIAGLDITACARNDPIFKNIIMTAANNENSIVSNQGSPKRLDQQIADAGSTSEIHEIVLKAAIAQLSTFLAIDADDIRESSAIADMGLDSLLAIEFKNWVVRTVQAPMQTSEILDAPSLSQLVELITRRSKLVQRNLSNRPMQNDVIKLNGVNKSIPVAVSTMHPELPALPIPELRTLIQRHLTYLRAFATEEEYRATLKLAADFQAPGSMGQRLYDRLQAIRSANPQTWYHDLYLRNQYLVRKGPLAPFMNFFFTHPETASSRTQSQAERAALVASAVIHYKTKLEKGLIKPRYVNEQPLCMGLYKYLFNTVREPAVGVDVLRQYPGDEYFVVLRRGHVYRIGFDQCTNYTGLQRRLIQAFEGILRSSETEEVDWFGILTAGNRISWAKVRHTFISASPENAAYIEAIEKSAFVICLDDGNPETPEERGRHFHFGDGSNRWHDKPVEFIIAANGASGIVGDHTALDAGTVHDLNMEIVNQIRQYQNDDTTSDNTRHVLHVEVAPVAHSPLDSNQEVLSLIESVKSSYTAACDAREHRYPPPLPYGSSLTQKHKVPANSVFQLIVQLAARYYFGRTEPCWETVLQSNFATGRVEINQVVTSQVAAFVDAAASVTDTGPDNKSRIRQLFVEAARTHSASVLACTRAGGSDRFLSMLREIVDTDAGEVEPGLYHDPVYKRARPRKLVSNCFTTGMAENGCTLRDEDGVWLHFEVEPVKVKFCILGPAGKTERFCECLARAATVVKEILESSA